MCPRFWFLDFLVNIESRPWSFVPGRQPILTLIFLSRSRYIFGNDQRLATHLLLRSGLANLLLQSLACVPNAFVLVRVRRTQRAHFRRYLSYLLTVDSSKRNLRLLGIDGSLYAGGQRIFDWV